MKPFTHLHVHSHYSLLNALPKIKDLVETAKTDGMKALALTDNCNMYGAIEFYKACESQEIKPIIGIDAYLAIRTRHDKEPRIDSRRTRLVLLAKNEAGYKNLIKLVSEAHLEGFYYKPRIDRESLEKFSKDLICIIPSFNSEVVNSVQLANPEKARESYDFLKNLFADDLYIEISHHPEIDGHEKKMEQLIDFAEKVNAKVVAAHDVFYMKAEDREARRTLMSIQQSFGSSDYFTDEEDFHFIDQKTANKYFKDLPKALENTQEIVNKCNLKLELGNWVFPEIDTESENYDEELRKQAYAGLERRKLELTPEIKERIEYELKVIKDKGYSPYFIVVADLLRFAKENEIFSNTRGSAAGSMVSYLVGITTVNPIDYRLPFERFLNPDRPSPPDIDMDFADDRRDEVIDYARSKYGQDAVAQIGTFGTMMARGSVRDTARAMGYDYEMGDKIARLIPMGSQGFPMFIDRALEQEPDFKKLYKEDTEVKKIVDMARKIEGCARHIGVHAAGVVISPTTIVDYSPIQFDPKGQGKIITQYNMHSIEEAGLLKFDFLGLKNLSIMANTVKLIEKLYSEKIDMDFVPLDDKKTYKMLAEGGTEATFQLNGDGMTRFLKELKPTNIDDINAMVALYRPGPLAFIPDYIERKHDPSKVKYLDPKLEEFLKPTYGILIYQDDILLIAVHLAGYSWGEADKFRKAVGKKIPEEMEKQKEKFINGCQEVGGFSRENAIELWHQIETFAAYGFNKAHAAAYGRVAYLTSFLKANYPVLYMASVLTADSGDTDKIAEMVTECKRMGIEVLPPDINESFEYFTVVGDQRDKESIRFGLTTIKNFGGGIAGIIIKEREENGKFKNIEEFLTRIVDRNLNKKSLEALIKSGAMDSLGNRSQLLHNLENFLKFNKEVSKGDKSQDSLFGNSEEISHLQLEEAPQDDHDQFLVWEKELLGLYVSGNPLDRYKDTLTSRESTISNIKKNKKLGVSTVVAGLIEDIREIQTKNGAKMAFVRIKDFDDNIEAVFFPKVYTTYKEMLESDNKCVAIKGKLNERNGELSVLVDKMKSLSNK